METAVMHFLGMIAEYELTKHKCYEYIKMETGNNSCKHRDTWPTKENYTRRGHNMDAAKCK
jgi:hypothetical protein